MKILLTASDLTPSQHLRLENYKEVFNNMDGKNEQYRPKNNWGEMT